MTIGERIKQRRIELGLSQEELSKKMGYKTRNAIYQFEQKDNMKLSIVEKFAEALETTPAYLMGWEEFTNEVQQGQVDLDELSHAMHMYELYRKSTPKVQEMIEYLLDEGNSSKASQQD